MICSQCGAENPAKFKFCVKCGSNLEDPQEINIEQIDMGGYHSEEEGEQGGFSFGSGTFTISDTAVSSGSSSELYTAEELNDDDEEFDFSSYDEPYIPKLDTERLSLPDPPHQQNAGMYGGRQTMGMQSPQMTGMPNMPNPQMNGMPNMQSPQMTGMPGMPNPQMNAMPNMQPSQMNGIPGGVQGVPPMYSQPMMYGQPQIIGYDASGMPIYGQPMMYGQPQIIGYDASGMPIYGQPMMYPQMQIIGYDPSGMPIYGQMYGQPQMPHDTGGQPYQQMPGMPGMPRMPGASMPGMPQYGVQQPVQEPPKEDKSRVNVPDDFWEFFDGGKSGSYSDADDFFDKHGGDGASSDMGRLKRFEHKRNDFMGDTPLVDADDLVPNTSAKFNKMYMRKTETVNADDLAAKEVTKTQDIMGITEEVNADDLDAHESISSGISMDYAGEADADSLEAYVPEHIEAIMAQAEEAVEALPKKKTTYNDEIDAIELPEYMQAKRSVKDDTPEIPGLPEI